MPAPLPENGLSLTRGGIAAVSDSAGYIDGAGATGIYVRDRRLIAGLEFLVNGVRPTVLTRVRTGPAEDRIVYGYWGEEPDPAVVIVRDRDLNGGYNERLEFRCFRSPIDIEVRVLLAVGGGSVYRLDECGDQEQLSAYLRRRITINGFSLASETLSMDAHVRLSPGDAAVLEWGIDLEIAQPDRDICADVRSSDPLVQRGFDHACWDLTALGIIDERTGLPFLAAGSPHFLAVFGRDSIIASMLTMFTGTGHALDNLRVLAAYQGTRNNPETVEQPGRILHELRVGEMGVFGLEPGVAYYGSVDSTPLFVVLLAECLAWGGDIVAIRELLPAARNAMGWCRSHVDSLGFLCSVPDPGGIGNQGWKDSGDSIVNPDGTIITEATSLVEVQGYVHAALTGLAELEEQVGDPDLAPGLRDEANDFRRLFLEHFEVEAPVHLALALDSSGEPVRVRASNVGHLLSTQIIDDDLAKLLVQRLLSKEEFSGWGLRTLAKTEVAYNPLGYHVGSVWPHDTAIFLRGLIARGFDVDAKMVAEALLDLAECHDGLPELLGGFDRVTFPSPVPYPSSARPQAWAAAVPVQIICALLGIRPVMYRNELRVRPLLRPDQSLIVENLRLGDRVLTISAHGRDVEVTGDVEGLSIIHEG
ncbi:MAG: glycogen debranching N-terminal domain-containing protein [Acidimicrobiales bacterium]